MAENNTLLEKLDGLVSRFEEVSTLITDPNVIADQKRYVKLTKEYKELNEIIKARKEYMQCLNGLEEARLMMAETDPEMREIAREEAAACEARIPELEEEIKLLLVPADPQDDKNAIVAYGCSLSAGFSASLNPSNVTMELAASDRLFNPSAIIDVDAANFPITSLLPANSRLHNTPMKPVILPTAALFLES